MCDDTLEPEPALTNLDTGAHLPQHLVVLYLTEVMEHAAPYLTGIAGR